MSEPSKQPPDEPPGGRRGGSGNLVPGIKPGQERGPDGKIRRKADPGEQGAHRSPACTLSTRTDGELAAMRWVTSHPPEEDETWEQRSAREFKESAPAGFYARKAKLEEQEAEQAAGADGSAPDAWDGEGPCPTCGREKEEPIEDAGTSKILAMLDELDGASTSAEARENAERAARPDARQVGRARQDALRQALAAELAARDAAAKAKRGRPVNETEQWFDKFSGDFHFDMRVRDLEFANRPDPENAIASIEHAITATSERERMWRGELADLEAGDGSRSPPDAVPDRALRPGRH
jgi:hypothetical protein